MTKTQAKSDEEIRLLKADAPRRSIYHTMLYTVFQKPRERDSSGVVIAVSSANPGAGVTHVTKALVHELERCEFNSVIGINTKFLRKMHEPTMEALRKSLSGAPVRSNAFLREVDVPDALRTHLEESGPWDGSWRYRRECIDLLRSEFNHTIIDCPSLEESGELLSVAPFVDGVILIVEANRTRRDQLRHAAQSIAAVQGNLLGYVLNKRKYEVPEWLYRKM